MRVVRARYITGLTATPQRRDGHHPILRFQLGPVRFSVEPRSQAALRRFEHRLTLRQTAVRLQGSLSDAGIQEVYAQLATDRARNEMILDDVIGALEAGRSPILLTERGDHLGYFADRIARVARHLVVRRGGMGAKQRREGTAQGHPGRRGTSRAGHQPLHWRTSSSTTRRCSEVWMLSRSDHET